MGVRFGTMVEMNSRIPFYLPDAIRSQVMIWAVNDEDRATRVSASGLLNILWRSRLLLIGNWGPKGAWISRTYIGNKT